MLARLILQRRMKSCLKIMKIIQNLRISLHHIRCFILKTQNDLSNELFDR